MPAQTPPEPLSPDRMSQDPLPSEPRTRAPSPDPQRGLPSQDPQSGPQTRPPLPAGPFAAVLFDMDGTLLTSIPAVERAWNAWAQRAGVDPAAVLAWLHGRTAADTIAHFLPPGRDLAEEVAWLDARECADLDGIAAIPGAAAFLAALPPGAWAVVTSANRALAQVRLAAAGLPLPGVLVSCNDVQRGKPDPEGFIRAARLLGVAPSACLVFEDTGAGLRAGLAAGAQAVQVLGTDSPGVPPGLPAITGYTGLGLRQTPQGLQVCAVPAG